jgi:hypothetical protein
LTLFAPSRDTSPVADGKPDIDALKILLDSAHELVADLAHGSTQRAISALARIPPDQRDVIATALEKAAVSWQQSEAFGSVHNIRLRANPHAQLFVRIFDPVEEPPKDDLDLLPEALRVMRRLGVSMHPELRAVWERAVVAARDMLTPDERADTIRFLQRALALVSEGAEVPQASDDAQPNKKSGSSDG